MYISDETIDRFIKEDVPYIDLTTMVLGIENETGKISFASREDIVLSGVEEVLRIFEKLSIQTTLSISSGTRVYAGETFIKAEGLASNLHMAWKVALNLLEYCCGIATRTRNLVDLAKFENKNISVVTTRKSFPGTKELAVKSIIAGGALPHRLGLSETVLIFKQHLSFFGGYDKLAQSMESIKTNACEKKIFVEVENEQEAILMASTGVDGIQFDKIPAGELKKLVNQLHIINPKLTLIAAGGINASNVKEYAATGVDAVATTSVYFGKPADIKVTMEKL